ncbi:hypothetical protein [Ilumatobacter sp.]|uniref:hypothetical protein n=1 Tax=Ilumatobacter sp. TaxID=1967498 RepID=UPI003C3ABB7C
MAAAIVVLVGFSLRSIAEHAPLGHDESVYALRGSYYSGDYSETRGYWSAYRAPGLPMLLGLVFRITGPSDSFARMTVLAFAVVFVLAVFAIGTMVASPWVGACAAALTAMTSAFARLSSLVFVDVAGVAVATLAIAAALFWWRGERLARPAYIVIPGLCGLATTIRFGAPVTIAAGMIGVVLVVGLRVGPGQRRRVALEAAALGMLTGAACAVVLFVPAATAQSVSPVSAQRAFRDAKGIPTWRSLEDLRRLLWPDGEPTDLFHPLVFAVFALGSVVALVDVARRRSISDAGVLFSVVSGLLSIVALNINLSHLESQYLFAVLPFAAVLAALGVCSIWQSVSNRGRFGTAGLFAVAVAVVLVFTFAFAGQLDRRTTSLDTSFRAIADAGYALRSLDVDDCVVVSGTTPQAGWYSQCAATPFVNRGPDVALGEQIRSGLTLVPTAGPTFILYPNRGKRQPDANLVDDSAELTLVAERGAPEDGPRQWVRIFAVDECTLDDACTTTP